MTTAVYTQFCPVAMACAMLEPRWTMLVLCELWSGSTRFNEIQRGVPGMLPSLLSKRLKEMQAKGLVDRLQTPGRGQAQYTTTPLADELRPLIHALGSWAHRNLDPSPGLEALDPRVLLWNIRRKIDVGALPRRRSVVQFILQEEGRPDFPAWLIIRPNAETDLCMIDPKDTVDLYITAELRALTSAWMGHTSFSAEIAAGRIELIGDALMARTLSKWLIRSSYAIEAETAAHAAAAE